MKEFITKKAKELEWKLSFLTPKNKYFNELNDYEEEKQVRKLTRKNMKEIDEFKKETKKL